jgi:hypothetical protein
MCVSNASQEGMNVCFAGTFFVCTVWIIKRALKKKEKKKFISLQQLCVVVRAPEE